MLILHVNLKLTNILSTELNNNLEAILFLGGLLLLSF